MWILDILLPIALVAGAAKLILVRSETRLRNAERTRKRLASWLATSHRRVKRHRAVWQEFDGRAERANGKSLFRVRASAGVHAVALYWQDARSRIGNHLMWQRHGEISRDIDYTEHKIREYSDYVKDDRKVGAELVAPGWTTTSAMFEKNGVFVVLGALIAISSTGIVWAFQELVGGSDDVGNSIREGGVQAFLFVVAVVIGSVVVLRARETEDARERERLFAWGCAIAVYLGLTTLEVSPLADSDVEKLIDAQKVNAMFIGVGIMLGLSRFFDQKGPVENAAVGSFEGYVATESDDLNPWARVSRWLTMGTRTREGLVAVALFAVYLLLATHGIGLIVWETWGGQGLGSPGVAPLLAVSVSTLVLPCIVLSDAMKSGWWVGLAGVFLAAIAFVPLCSFGDCGRSGASMVIVCAAVNVDTAASIESSVLGDTLSEVDRETLEGHVLFDFNSHDIRDSVALYQKMAVLRDNRWVDIRIEGHTDTVGRDEYNMKLGSKRAGAVLAFLADSVNLERLDATSFGEERVLNQGLGNTDNRRVEFVVMERATRLPVIVWDAVVTLDTVARKSGEPGDVAPGCIALSDLATSDDSSP